jgi:hypothetical protein
MMCPCIQCQGKERKTTRSIQMHLNLNRRHLEQLICYEADENDSSDDEWEIDWARRTNWVVGKDEMDVAEGLNIPKMMKKIFESVDQMRSRFDSEHEEEDYFPAHDLNRSQDFWDQPNNKKQIKTPALLLYMLAQAFPN